MSKKRKSKQVEQRRIRHDSIDAAMAFEAGKNDYRLFKPRPPTPTNENCDEPQSMRFYGWMMARAREVGKIIADVRAQCQELGLSEKKGDALLTKRTAALDAAHSPDGKDRGPIW